MLHRKSIFAFLTALLAALITGCGSDSNNTEPTVNAASTSALQTTSSTANISSEPTSNAASSAMGISMMPQSLANTVMHLTIDDVQSLAQTGTHATSGMFVVRYGDNGTLVNEGILPWNPAYAATYHYSVNSENTAQDEITLLGESNVVVTTQYTFMTENTGTWVQNYNDSEIIYEGSFIVTAEPYTGFAPASLEGLSADIEFLTSVSNQPAGSYPTEGIATHIYNTATTFSTDGSQINTANTIGSYTAEKLSPNVIRDRGFNNTFNDVYEIVYTFETLTSGTFTEDWGNGQILWTGVFNIKPIE